MPDVGSAIGAGVSLIGGLNSADAASSAADEQSKSANASIAEQRRQYNQTRTDTAPYRDAGSSASNALSYLLGIGGTSGGTPATAGFTPLTYDQWAAKQPSKGLSGNTSWMADLGLTGGIANALAQQRAIESSQSSATPEGYQQYLAANPAVSASSGTPAIIDSNYGSLLKPFSQNDLNNDVVYNTGLQFGLDQGNQAIDRRAAASGGWDSGATLKALAKYANDYGTTKAAGAQQRFMGDKEFTYNSLGGIANRGVQATGLASGVGTSTANNISSSLSDIGNANAAGTIGAANAYNGIFGGIANQIPSNSSIFTSNSSTNRSTAPTSTPWYLQ